MPPPRQTVSAAAAHYVAFTAHAVADLKVADVRTRLDNLAYKLMPDHQRDGDRLPRPIIPLVDMQVCSADACSQHPYLDIIDANRRFGHIFNPQTALGRRL